VSNMEKLRYKKLSFSPLTFIKTYGILFLHKLTFCSLNKLGTLQVESLNHWGYLMMRMSPSDIKVSGAQSLLSIYIGKRLLLLTGEVRHDLAR